MFPPGADGKMASEIEIVSVDAANVAKFGFFCYKSKPKSVGYQRKLHWLEGRFAEGLKIKILFENGRSVGFIEYVPGEFAWRAVNAADYMVIHCMWVVGRGKGKGYGSRLLDSCIRDAQATGKSGVAMVTSSWTWLAGKELFLKNGFESVDQVAPWFELLVKRTGQAPSPTFPDDWNARLRRYGPGLTIIRSDQCPYIDSSVKSILAAADELSIESRVIELNSPREAQTSAPSPYALFNVVYNGRLLTYHPISGKDLPKLMEQTGR